MKAKQINLIDGTGFEDCEYSIEQEDGLSKWIKITDEEGEWLVPLTSVLSIMLKAFEDDEEEED